MLIIDSAKGRGNAADSHSSVVAEAGLTVSNNTTGKCPVLALYRKFAFFTLIYEMITLSATS
jgi:hypothetical protein